MADTVCGDWGNERHRGGRGNDRHSGRELG